MNVPIELLRCPISGQAMHLAPASTVERFQEAQRCGQLRTREGAGVDAFEDGLLTDDGRWFYPIRGGIPVLLAGEAIAVVDRA